MQHHSEIIWENAIATIEDRSDNGEYSNDEDDRDDISTATLDSFASTLPLVAL